MKFQAEYLLEYRFKKHKKGLRNKKFVKLKWAYNRFKQLNQKCNYIQLVKFQEGFKPTVIFKNEQENIQNS